MTRAAHTAPTAERVLEPRQRRDPGDLPGIASGAVAGADWTSPALAAAAIAEPHWQSAQRIAVVDGWSRTAGNGATYRILAANGHVGRDRAGADGDAYVQRTGGEPAVQREPKVSAPIAITYGGDLAKGTWGPIEGKLSWAIEGSLQIGPQAEKTGEWGVGVGPTGGATRGGGGKHSGAGGVKLEPAYRLWGDKMKTATVDFGGSLDAKTTFAVTTSGVDISVGLEGTGTISTKDEKYTAGVQGGPTLTLLKHEFKDAAEGKPSSTKFANGSFTLSRLGAVKLAEDVTFQGKLSVTGEAEPNWAWIMKRAATELGKVLTEGVITTALTAGIVLAGIATIVAAAANITEGAWIGGYCSSKAAAFAEYLRNFDLGVRGLGGGGDGGKDGLATREKILADPEVAKMDRDEAEKAIAERPAGFYAATAWNREKANVLAKAQLDFWNEHWTVRTKVKLGLGELTDDKDYQLFMQALNAHIDGQMAPVIGIKASWVNA